MNRRGPKSGEPSVVEPGVVHRDESAASPTVSKRDKFLKADRGELGNEDAATEEGGCEDCIDHCLVCDGPERGGIVTEICESIAAVDEEVVACIYGEGGMVRGVCASDDGVRNPCDVMFRRFFGR